MNSLNARVRAVLHTEVVGTSPLPGGCVADARKLVLSDGRTIVAKLGDGRTPGLAREGFMLTYLAEHTKLPVPCVLWADDELLLMEYLISGDALNAAAEEDAAMHLAALHSITAPQFGFEDDTLIGGLRQPNHRNDCWRTFFRDQRLLFMAQESMMAGKLPLAMLGRVERLCARLDDWLPRTSVPSLIHGDMWSGNVLVRGRKVVGFIDPAIYFADAEIELAFATLFETFGAAFFRRYGELRPLRPGFFEERRDLYNLYPLLVHVRLFGGSYVGAVDRILKRFSF